MRLSWVCLCLLGLTASAMAGDWLHWRGPSFNGVSAEKDIPATFDIAEKTNLAWSAPYGCRSTPLYFNGRLFFNSGVGEKDIEQQERVVCLDASDGKLIWEKRFNVWQTDIVANRVGWTQMVGDPATGNVYCHGTQGLLTCFDPDGKILWQHSLGEEFGRVGGYGGRLTSPLVDGDLVIVGMACAPWGEYGRGGFRLVAFDTKTGQIAWWGSTVMRVRDTNSSTPIAANIGGQRLVIMGGADGAVHAFKVRTGEKVWSYSFSAGAVNCTPVVKGDHVFIGHGEVNPGFNQQGRVICLDGATVSDGKPKVVWEVFGLKIKFASPVLDGDHLIVNDEKAKLYCLNTKTGEEIWGFKYGRGGGNVRNSPVLCDGKLYVGDADSQFHIIDISGKKPKKLHTEYLQSAKPGVNTELDGSAAIANGCLFFSTNDTMYCIAKARPNRPANGKLTPWKEEKVETNAKPAHLQVYPADVTLGPGQSQSFKARLYDDRGRFIREVKAEWSLGKMLAPEPTPGLPPPPKINPPELKGELTADGKLTLPEKGPAQFGAVVATAEGVTGRARVRVYTNLPIKQDFSKIPAGASPAGWVNTQVKFAVRKVGDSNVLVKTATNPSPLVARANAYLGMPNMSNYTIETEALATTKKDEFGDMAVVANHYRFGLYGNTQQLRLLSWNAVPRIDRSISYDWKPNVWYHLKMTIEVKDKKGIVRGKVWERGKPEPAEWTLEVEDPLPNTDGSPALYANIPTRTIDGPMKPGAEVYFANVVVTPNKK
jgi:outer membrane protein assembly factor BamB